MRAATLFGLASAVTTALAHTTVFGVWVNGVDQGDGQNRYIRSPPSNSPVKDVTSSDIRCNVNGDKVAPQNVEVKAGDKLTFEWKHDTRDDDIIDRSHKGPVLVYMSEAAGREWTKVFEDSFNGQWAVDRLVDEHGQHSIVIPDVPAGNYLLRAEIIAHHESDTRFTQNRDRGAQFYPSCVQIRVASNGSKKLPGGATFPGTYTDAEPGIHFNLYGASAAGYKAPGPSVWSETAGGSIGRVGIPGQGPVTPQPIPSPAQTTAAPAAPSSAPTPAPQVPAPQVPAPQVPAPQVPSPEVPAPQTDKAALYAQCGGRYFSGPSACVDGATCTFNNAWYSQCLPAANNNGNNTVAPVAPAPHQPQEAVQIFGQCGGKGYAYVSRNQH
ncbi:endoglucanase B [Coprinopsis sp. MPI-PUGE-AT-0042]|nr:endoglucanase B [Coprinopsis sp. MPI-PUGE-AT-0042]